MRIGWHCGDWGLLQMMITRCITSTAKPSFRLSAAALHFLAAAVPRSACCAAAVLTSLQGVRQAGMSATPGASTAGASCAAHNSCTGPWLALPLPADRECMLPIQGRNNINYWAGSGSSSCLASGSACLPEAACPGTGVCVGTSGSSSAAAASCSACCCCC